MCKIKELICWMDFFNRNVFRKVILIYQNNIYT